MKQPEITAGSHRAYLPAAGRDFFLPIYDLITRLMGADRARAAVLDRVELKSGQRVLDIGCGTGSLAVLVKQRYPQVEIVGLDPDPKALARAQRKAQQAQVSLKFDRGFADALAYPENSFDWVFSAFMFHHLPSDRKEPALREIRRVLKPHGSLYLVDFAGPDVAGKTWFSRFFTHTII